MRLIITLIALLTLKGNCAEKHDLSDFTDMYSSFCKNEKAIHAIYDSKLMGKIMLPVINDGELELQFQCPAKMRAHLKHTPFDFEFISDGIQAWVKTSTKLEKRIERYDDLTTYHIGEWIKFFQELSEGTKTTTAISFKKAETVMRDANPRKVYRFEDSRSSFIVNFSPSMKKETLWLEQIGVKGDGYEFNFSLKKVLSKGKEFPPLVFNFVPLKGDIVQVITDSK